MAAVTKAGAAAELDDISNSQCIPSRRGRERGPTRQSKSRRSIEQRNTLRHMRTKRSAIKIAPNQTRTCGKYAVRVAQSQVLLEPLQGSFAGCYRTQGGAAAPLTLGCVVEPLRGSSRMIRPVSGFTRFATLKMVMIHLTLGRVVK